MVRLSLVGSDVLQLFSHFIRPELVTELYLTTMGLGSVVSQRPRKEPDIDEHE